MTKKRLIGVVLVRNGIAVQSIGFQKYLPIGKPEIAIEYLNRWGIDEICVLHMSATLDLNQIPTAKQVESYSKNTFVPLSIGGGIQSTHQVREIIQAGADKVVFNTALWNNPGLITETGQLFGHQSVLVSIDFKESNDTFKPHYRGSQQQPFETLKHACLEAQSRGAGELLLNSVDQDGSKSGFKLNVHNDLEDIHIPKIICGGAGHPEHFIQGLDKGFDAVAAANLFHYNEHSVILLKKYMKEKGKSVRLDSYVNYSNLPSHNSGRSARASDEYLDHLRFRYIPEEKI